MDPAVCILSTNFSSDMIWSVWSSKIFSMNINAKDTKSKSMHVDNLEDVHQLSTVAQDSGAANIAVNGNYCICRCDCA